MKVCAEFEDQVTALNAHKALLDKGAEADDIEVRSPYPLAEEPIPEHRSKPMIMRNLVRLMWLCGIVGGFAFISFTQLEWGLTAQTGGQPLVAVPINAVIMYECGMITAILVTTLMFFVETRRYRQLVPALEEDMPVAIGYIALVVSGDSAKKAEEWLKGLGARNVVSYLLPLLCVGLFGTGCAKQPGQSVIPLPTNNMRSTVVIKPGEKAAALPPSHSVRMPSQAEQEVLPPEPLGWLTYGDPVEYERAQERLKTYQEELEAKVKSGELRRPDVNKLLRARREMINETFAPELLAEKGGIPPELQDYSSPVPATEESLARGQELYTVNCASCHGSKGGGDGKVGEVWAPSPPAIGGSDYQEKLSDGAFYFYIMTGKNNMPHFGNKLNTREVFDIVNHLRHLQQAG